MKILVVNAGSTSLKFKLFDMPSEQVLCEAKEECIGREEKGSYQYSNIEKGINVSKKGISIGSYTEGIQMFIQDVVHAEHGVIGDIAELSGIGYKAVLAQNHYGVHLVDDKLIGAMEEAAFISPTHTRPYVDAIMQFQALLPDTPMVCSFETAFHETIPMHRRVYPIPYDWTEQYGLLRRGYHGASHSFIAYEAERRFGTTGRLISCHLGGSSSMCAIKDGKSEDCTFGFSLQTGLPHGKRTGDIDSYLIPYLLQQGMPEEKLYHDLNERSGLAGVSGISDDMREIQEAAANGNHRAQLAIEMFVNAIAKSAGAYFVELGGFDHWVFTGGIGENSPYIRSLIGAALAPLGIILDEEKNRSLHGEGCISAGESSADLWVIPTSEEIMVARATFCELE